MSANKIVLFGGKVVFRSQAQMMAAMGRTRVDKSTLQKYGGSFERMAIAMTRATCEDDCVRILNRYLEWYGDMPNRAKFKCANETDGVRIVGMITTALNAYLAERGEDVANVLGADAYDDLVKIAREGNGAGIKSFIDAMNKARISIKAYE